MLCSWHRSRLFQACDDGSSEGVESVLGEEVTEEDKTALVNLKDTVSDLLLVIKSTIQQPYCFI